MPGGGDQAAPSTGSKQSRTFLSWTWSKSNCGSDGRGEVTFDAPKDGAYEAAQDSVAEAVVEGAIVDASADEQAEDMVLFVAEVRPCLFQQTRRPNASFSESENLRPGDGRGTRGTGAKPGFSEGMGGSSGVVESWCLGTAAESPGPGLGGVLVPNLGGGLPLGAGLEPNLGASGLPASRLAGIGLQETRSESFTGVLVSTGLLFVVECLELTHDIGLSDGRGVSFTGLGLLILVGVNFDGVGLLIMRGTGLPEGHAVWRGRTSLIAASNMAPRGPGWEGLAAEARFPINYRLHKLGLN